MLSTSRRFRFWRPAFCRLLLSVLFALRNRAVPKLCVSSHNDETICATAGQHSGATDLQEQQLIRAASCQQLCSSHIKPKSRSPVQNINLPASQSWSASQQQDEWSSDQRVEDLPAGAAPLPRGPHRQQSRTCVPADSFLGAVSDPTSLHHETHPAAQGNPLPVLRLQPQITSPSLQSSLNCRVCSASLPAGPP